MSTNYLDIAGRIAGQDQRDRVVFVARQLHNNKSIHLHNLGDEKKHHGSCSYCLLDAAQAVRAVTAFEQEVAR